MRNLVSTTKHFAAAAWGRSCGHFSAPIAGCCMLARTGERGVYELEKFLRQIKHVWLRQTRAPGGSATRPPPLQ